MPDSLADLEGERALVQSQLAQLGDMRAGSVTGTGGCWGNPNCHRYRSGDRGHGPDYRLTRKVDGKAVTETFSSPATLALFVGALLEDFSERRHLRRSRSAHERVLGKRQVARIVLTHAPWLLASLPKSESRALRKAS